MTRSLPGIVRIAYIGCAAVPPHMEWRCLAGIPAAIYDLITEVSFTGMPVCITESQYDHHAQVERSQLTFHSTADLPIRQELAFLIMDAMGQWWLLGHHEPQYPTIKRTHHTGVPDTDRAGYTYEVTLIGRKTLIPVAV